MIPCLPMFFSTWETYHTHTLYLGYFNGPTGKSPSSSVIGQTEQHTRGTNHCLLDDGFIRILRPPNLDAAAHRLDRLAGSVWISVSRRCLDPADIWNLHVHTPTRMHTQRYQSPSSTSSAYRASFYRMATDHRIHGLMHSLAVLALLNPHAGKPTRSFLPYDVFRLWADDNKDHPCPSHPTALSALDRHAYAIDRRSSPRQPSLHRFTCCHRTRRTMVPKSLLCFRSRSLFPMGASCYQQYLLLSGYQLLDYHTQTRPTEISCE